MPEVAAREPNEYLTDRLNREAMDFIRRHKGAPFFLYLSHYAVHTKLSAAGPELLAKYAQKLGAGQDRNNPERQPCLRTWMPASAGSCGRSTS